LPKEPVNDELMMRYLLGGVSDEEQVRLEELYFVDDRVFEEVAALEDELIDAYVRGELSDTQRKQFELNFLNSAERRRKLAFAESFTQYLSLAPAATTAAEPETWPNRITGWLGIHGSTARWAFAAAGAVVLLVGAGLVRENWRLRTQLRQMQAEQTELRQREDQLNRQLALHNEPPIRSAPGKAPAEMAGAQPQSLPIVALALAPGLLRGDTEQKTLLIPHGPHLVQLQLALEDNQSYGSYLATLETAEGTRIWSKAGLKTTPQGETHIVALEMPSSLLGNKDYILKLRGVRSAMAQTSQNPSATQNLAVEEIGVYSFRVVKR